MDFCQRALCSNLIIRGVCPESIVVMMEWLKKFWKQKPRPKTFHAPTLLSFKQETLFSVLQEQDAILDIIWKHLKRFSMLSLIAGQAMVMLFFHKYGLNVINLYNYTLISVEVFVVTSATILILSFYIIFPVIYLRGVLGIKNVSGFVIFTVFFAALIGFLFYKIFDNRIFGSASFFFLLIINFILTQAKAKTILRISPFLQYLVPLTVLFLYSLLSFVQNSTMNDLGILQHPAVLYIIKKSDSYTHLKNFCKKMPQIENGLYDGFHHATVLYGGPKHSYVIFDTSKCHFKEMVKSKNIALT